MDEYIKREDVYDALKNNQCELCDNIISCSACSVGDALKNIQYIHSADVVEVRHGEWIQGDYYDIGDVCSECDFDSNIDHCCWRYCPNCGAKMDGKGEGE